MKAGETTQRIRSANLRTFAGLSRYYEAMASKLLSPSRQQTTADRAPQGPPAVPPERSVFADSSGRRDRILTLIGRALAVVLLLWLAAVGAGLAGLGTLPGVPDIGSPDEPTAGQPGAAEDSRRSEPATAIRAKFWIGAQPVHRR